MDEMNGSHNSHGHYYKLVLLGKERLRVSILNNNKIHFLKISIYFCKKHPLTKVQGKIIYISIKNDCLQNPSHLLIILG